MQIDRDTPLNDYQSLLNATDDQPNIPLTDGIGQMTGIAADPVTARFVGPGRARLSQIRADPAGRAGLKGHPTTEDKYNSDTNTVSLREN